MIRKGICIVLLAVLLSLRACAYSEHKRPQKAEYERYKASDQENMFAIRFCFAAQCASLARIGVSNQLPCAWTWEWGAWNFLIPRSACLCVYGSATCSQHEWAFRFLVSSAGFQRVWSQSAQPRTIYQFSGPQWRIYRQALWGCRAIDQNLMRQCKPFRNTQHVLLKIIASRTFFRRQHASATVWKHDIACLLIHATAPVHPQWSHKESAVHVQIRNLKPDTYLSLWARQ